MLKPVRTYFTDVNGKPTGGGIIDYTDYSSGWGMYPDALDLETAKQRFDLSPVIEEFGTWVVTKYGMECLVNYYPIKKDRLWEMNWIGHMSEKTYGVYGTLGDFVDCLEAARIYHGPKPEPKPRPPVKVMVVREPKPLKVRMIVTPRDRFTILKRDKYRCRICGRDASNDVKLHIDHIIAKSKGGTAEHVNLWTLCDQCNHGKFTDDL